MMKKIPILDPLYLPKNSRVLFEIDYPMFENETHKLIQYEDYIVFWSKYKSLFTKENKISQIEFPFESIAWFTKTIENNYWGNEGDKSSNSENRMFSGESIGISSMMHCCSENLPGYNFWNKSRVDHVSNRSPQSWLIPRYMLKEGLLEKLKRIS
ncbi:MULTISPECIES: hypothetical protein [unclassified Agarivorans]|uniref:hypothetical protein n=1 Tax=unclassified Agarivorans TaxID=2636026 RepID=UPI003D7E0F28